MAICVLLDMLRDADSGVKERNGALVENGRKIRENSKVEPIAGAAKAIQLIFYVILEQLICFANKFASRFPLRGTGKFIARAGECDTIKFNLNLSGSMSVVPVTR